MISPATLRRWFLGIAALLLPSTTHATVIVADEATRLAVLKLVFPDARIAARKAEPVRRRAAPINEPISRAVMTIRNQFEYSYDVTGPVTEGERLTATDLSSDSVLTSGTRQLGLRVYRWKPLRGAPLLVAAMSYSFPAANPARCCWAVGKILLLSESADRILDSVGHMPHAFTGFPTVEFLDVEGSGAEKLLIRANGAGAGNFEYNLTVFDLTDRKLTPLLSLPTLVYDGEGEIEIYTLKLDIPRTILAKGARYFFVRKTFATKGRAFLKPHISRESYRPQMGTPLAWD